MTTSPLPLHSIDELFSIDPLLITDAELDLLIAHSRELRAKFTEAEARGGAKGKKGAGEAVNVDFDALKLEV